MCVDSGMLVIVDPCYLTPEDVGNFKERAYEAADGVKRAGEFVATGPATAAAFRSGYGDGTYPVFATYDAEGHVVKVEIDLTIHVRF